MLIDDDPKAARRLCANARFPTLARPRRIQPMFEQAQGRVPRSGLGKYLSGRGAVPGMVQILEAEST
jgi:hypothetical protein